MNLKYWRIVMGLNADMRLKNFSAKNTAYRLKDKLLTGKEPSMPKFYRPLHLLDSRLRKENIRTFESLRYEWIVSLAGAVALIMGLGNLIAWILEKWGWFKINAD